MFRYGFLWRVLLALLIIGVLVGGSMALYRFGWAQGYQAGAVISNGGSSGAAPQLPYYAYPPRYFYPGFGFPFFFFPFGPLLGIGFFLLFFFLIGGLFRFGRPRRYGWEGHPGDPDWREQHEKNEKGNQPERGE